MAKTPSNMPELAMAAPPFSLPDPSGKVVSLSDFDGLPVLVIFMCNHCPYVKHIADELARIGHAYHDKGLAIVGINSNDANAYPADAPDKMAEEVLQRGYVFPYLFDETQEVAKAYMAACTPDFFLFDADHKLVYRGQFDASRPGNGVAVTGHDIRQALDAVIENKPLSQDQIPSLGCNIKWKPGNEPTYWQ